MKVFATADWHLGNTFMGQDRLPEQRIFLSWLFDRIKEEKPDLLLVAGDVFDNPNPSVNAQKAYFEFIGRVMRETAGMRVIIIAGNHDSASRLTMTSPIFSPLRVNIVGEIPGRWVEASDGSAGHREFDYDKVIFPVRSLDGSEEIVVVAFPYLRSDIIGNRSYSAGSNEIYRAGLARASELNFGKPIVMMAHAYASGAVIAATDASERIIGGQEEVRLEDWEGIRPSFLVCGHIHRAQWIWGTDWARYPGSVLPMSIAERHYSHGIDIINIASDGSTSTDRIPFRPPRNLVVVPDDDTPLPPAELRRAIKSALKELPKTEADNRHYVVVKLPADRLADTEERQKIVEIIEDNGGLLLAIKGLVIADDFDGAETASAIATPDDIINRDPREAFAEAFIAVNSAELSESQEALVNDIIEAALLSDSLQEQ